jgi:penicillin-binding protein 1A
MPKRTHAKQRRRIWRRIVVGSGLVVVLAGGLAGWIVYRELSANLPPVDKLLRYQLPVATRVYADDGTLLGEFYTEKRYLVPIAQIPAVVRQAFIAAEDASFYRHKGVDVLGIVRATIANLTAGEVVQGGSTITQQVVKALLLTPERSYERKAKEILLALRLERQLGKDEILYLYLNLIYLGNGAYGVGAAAQEYYGKEVADLTLAEAAMLAGLPQAPSRYSPVRHWESAKYRQRYVLERMAREGYISWEEAGQALQAGLRLTRHDPETPAYTAAPYFVEHVRRFLEERYGGTAPYQLGLNVSTTVNLAMQKAAETALRSGIDEVDHGRTRARPLRRLSSREAQRFLAAMRAAKPTAAPAPGHSYRALVLGPAEGGTLRIQVNRFSGRLVATPEHPLPQGVAANDVIAVRRLPGANDNLQFALDADPQLEGALVSIDLATGYVKAFTGGYDFGRSQFNRVTQALRQPGSAFKPFVYAAALDRGYTPASIIIDEPIVLAGAREAWIPQNYDEKFNGPTTLRNALTFSRNVVTVKVAQNIGLNYLVSYLPRFGFGHPFEKNLSLALGSAEVSLLELTRAYTVFANQGRRLDPIFITKITDPHGAVLEEFKPRSESVLSPETAYIITSMLKSVVERGTGRRVRALGRPTAGKTGTTNDMHDAWFVGYTPELATGVWVGYDSERSLGKDQTGGHVAAPIFLAYMQAALGNAPVSDFPVPEGITFVSMEPGTGRPASPDSTAATLECFKQGTEPRWASEESPFVDDDLERAVSRLRAQRGEGNLDTEQQLAPDGDQRSGAEEWPTGDPEADYGRRPSDDGEAGYGGHRPSRDRGLDERPAPRAEDYLAPIDDKYDRHLRRDEAEAGEYRANEPRRRRGIVEEPLSY